MSIWKNCISQIEMLFPYLKTKMLILWTNSYFITTVCGVPLSVVKQYIESQKTSQRY